jgi:hypothetical protein
MSLGAQFGSVLIAGCCPMSASAACPRAGIGLVSDSRSSFDPAAIPAAGRSAHVEGLGGLVTAEAA